MPWGSSRSHATASPDASKTSCSRAPPDGGADGPADKLVSAFACEGEKMLERSMSLSSEAPKASYVEGSGWANIAFGRNRDVDMGNLTSGVARLIRLR